MKHRIFALVLALTLLFGLLPNATVEAVTSINTFNGEELTFAEWSQAGIGAWAETDGVLAPVELSDFSLLRLEKDLGEYYTIEFDVKQEDLTSGWQTIQIGFDVNAGENFTQSGLVLDLHNAGVGRVITYADKDKSDGSIGSYGNPYGGNAGYGATTNWMHVSITRNGNDYIVSFHDGSAKTISFNTEAFGGGHLVIGAVGTRQVAYTNFTITTSDAPPEPSTPVNTFNGEELTFAEWSQAGIGAWAETDGVLAPTEISEFSLLRLEKDLGEYYTVAFDVKQEDLTSGWQTIQIGFDVNPGENFTQSGLVLDLHNAGVGRVITYADKDKGDGSIGSYGNPYGGNAGYGATTNWMRVTITRSGSDYTVTFNDGAEKTITFTTDAFNGGYLVIGAVGSRMVSYTNITITTTEAPPPVEPDVPEEPVSVNTFNGEELTFAEWSQAGIGAWAETDGVLAPTEISEFSLLRLEKDLGEYYTVAFDVKQEDLTSGWQTIQIGFDVNAGENFTQSGLVLDLHNAGVGRVITYADKDKGDGSIGSYGNPYGGNAVYAPITDWMRVKIVRAANDYTVTFNDGTEKTVTFTTDAFNGGYLVIGAVGSRQVSYTNITVTTTEAPEPPVEPDDPEEPVSVNTFNGEELTFAEWSQAGIGAWAETDGVLAPTEISEFSLLRLEKDLGEYYSIEFDVKQEDLASGWQTIQIGFDVNPGENFTQSGLVLDLHNAGFARVVTYADKDKSDDTVGSYSNPFGGTLSYAPMTEWMRVTIARSGNDYTVTFNDGEAKTIAFTTDAFNGGYLVIGAVGSRMVSYTNITITTTESPEPPVEPEDPEEPVVNVNTFNGEALTFTDWTQAGDGEWAETDGILAPTALSEFSMLRLEKDLGENFIVEFDVKQEDLTTGWQTIQIGFAVNAGENFTQSGLVLDLHNAGVGRVITYADKDKGDGSIGSYGNPYGGNLAYGPKTEWMHVTIIRSGDSFVVTFHDGAEKKSTFSSDAFGGGYLVIGSVGSRQVSYTNFVITTDTNVDIEPEPEEVCATIFNGEPLSFSNWSNAAFGSWSQVDGIIKADQQNDFSLLRLNRPLGKNYVIEFDVKQADNYSGWNTIQIGFEVNAGENFTQSGLTLDMHNAGFTRVISFKDSNGSGKGSYADPYGGNADFSATTNWMHVRIARNGDKFKVTVNDGTEKTLIFTTDAYNGGHLVIGSVGFRDVYYKNIVIRTSSTAADVGGEVTEEKKPALEDRAVSKETEGGINTFNGEEIPFEQWSNAGFTPWEEMNGILYPVNLTEFGLWRYDRALGDTYTIELDVKQADISTGWNTIMLGFDVNAGENFTQSGLTLDLHNAGVARVIDFTNRENKSVKFGSYDSPWGGSVDYKATTQWMHIKIERLKSYYTVTINDGTEKVIRFETGDYNGGHLVIGAVGNRDIIYKNIHIKDSVDTMAPADPTYPESFGTTVYRPNGNAFNEWVPTSEDAWTADGAGFTQTVTEGEQTLWLDAEPMRNFKLFLNYEVLSEGEGTFGISFRKKTGAASYQGLGYALIFKIGQEENTLTLADYTASGEAALDGVPHVFELAGNVTITASGNEFCVWLDDELIINLNSNAYAYGTISLFTVNCSVEFTDIEITADALLSDDAWDLINACRNGEEMTQEMRDVYEQLSEFQKSMIPSDVKLLVEAETEVIVEPPVEERHSVAPVIIGCGIAALLVIAVIILIARKKKK